MTPSIRECLYGSAFMSDEHLKECLEAYRKAIYTLQLAKSHPMVIKDLQATYDQLIKHASWRRLNVKNTEENKNVA